MQILQFPKWCSPHLRVVRLGRRIFLRHNDRDARCGPRIGCPPTPKLRLAREQKSGKQKCKIRFSIYN